MLYKLICLFSFLCTAIFTVFAQENETDVINVTKLTILNPGLSYEARIGKFQTVYAHEFMSISGYFSYSTALGTQSKVYFDPATDLQYRFYYNGRKRFKTEKRTEMNSMNNVAIMSEFILTKMRLSDNYTEESSRRVISKFGVGWGFQRNYAQHFSLDINLGLGYLISKGTQYVSSGQAVKKNISMPTTMGQLNIGFWLNRKRE